MPRTWTSEIALASGGVALSVAAGALGAKLAGAVDGLGFTEAVRRFVAGGISGAVAKTISAPLEAIKLKLQYAEDDDEGALDCARRIFEREGWRGFYRGNLANVLRYFPTQAFNFAFKDKIKGLLPKVDRKKHPWRAFGVNVVTAASRAPPRCLWCIRSTASARNLLFVRMMMGRPNTQTWSSSSETGTATCGSSTKATPSRSPASSRSGRSTSS